MSRKRTLAPPAKHAPSPKAASGSSQPLLFPRCNWMALIILFALTLAVFADVLFSTQTVLSAPNTDLASQFVAWREFAINQIKAGHFPLWNPHIFSGAPYFGGFQAALLYPPNLLYLLLPFAAATNIGIALHGFLLGAFVYLWGRERGQSPLAALIPGTLAMYCGAYFPHVYAGHLSNICTMAWVPLLFLSIDRVFNTGRWSAALLGMLALAMMLLAGHPQYVYYSGVAAGIYTLLCLAKTKSKLRPALLLAALVAGGVALSAAQLGAGMQATSETIRSKGVSFEFASMFSFPPENLLTLLIPGVFGNMTIYWGRCYLWEMSMFISVTGFALAVFGALQAPAEKRRWAITMFLSLFVLALGSHTPLFAVLFKFLPGFNKFRGLSKFTFQATLFLLMLTGAGADELFRRGRAPKPMVGIIAATGVILLLAGIWFQAGATPDGWMSGAIRGMISTQESYLPPAAANNAEFLQQAGAIGAHSCWLSAVFLLALAGGISLFQQDRRWAYGLASLAALEGLVFAYGLRDTFSLDSVRRPQLEQFLTQHKGDFRTLNLPEPNLAMQLGTYEMWGYDPNVVTRYAEWMTFTQGGNPDEAGQYLQLHRIDPLYKMLRCKYVFTSTQRGQIGIKELADPLPHAFLVGSSRVLEDRNAIFHAMQSSDFDPTKQAIFQTAPQPQPESSEGTVKIIGQTTDSLTIEADNPKPSALVITDLWTNGWRVRDLEGKNHYDLLPANYILQAVPLAAGHHKLIVEYSPTGWRVGVWVSIIALIAYIAGLAVVVPFERRKAVAG